MADDWDGEDDKNAEARWAAMRAARSGPHLVYGFALAAIVFLADQISKWIVISILRLPDVQLIQLLPFFDLNWVENRGISLGLFTAGSEAGRWILVIVTALVAGGIGWWLTREKNRIDATGLALILGGALGNILDRIRYGYVADFADLHFGTWRPFLVFNVADAAITIGVLLLLVRALLTREPKDKSTQ